MKKLILLSFFFLINSFSTSAHPGIGIVMDSEGNVYYTDLTHVWKISPDGERTIAVHNVHTHELHLDERGNLYGEHEWYEGEATDKWGNYVWCLSKDGVLEKIIPDVEGFLDNNTLVRDNQNNSYWIGHSETSESLMKTDVNGNEVKLTHHEFEDIRWLHYSKSNDNVYVVDNLSIKKVDQQGNMTLVAENLKEKKKVFQRVADRHYVFGLWTDNDQNLYVALYGAKKVKKISPSGKVSTVFKSPLGWSPCGGMMADDGTLWIMEFSKRNKTRVRAIRPDGENQVFN